MKKHGRKCPARSKNFAGQVDFYLELMWDMHQLHRMHPTHTGETPGRLRSSIGRSSLLQSPQSPRWGGYVGNHQLGDQLGMMDLSYLSYFE